MGPSADLTPKYSRTHSGTPHFTPVAGCKLAAVRLVGRDFIMLQEPEIAVASPTEVQFSLPSQSDSGWVVLLHPELSHRNAWLPRSLLGSKRKKGVIMGHVYKGQAWK